MNSLKKQILSVAVATSTVLSCVPVSMAAIPADVQGTRLRRACTNSFGT